MREAIFRGDARRQFAALTEADQAEVQAIVSRLEIEPSINGRTIFEAHWPPLVLRVFDNSIWRIMFQVPDDATVAVFSIRRTWP